MHKRKMISIGLVVIAGLLAGALPAEAGTYDGLWVSDDGDSFTMIRSDGNLFLAVNFDVEGDYSEIFIGTIEGNSVAIQSYNASPQIAITGTFVSNTQFSGTITACTGECQEGVIGADVNLMKLF